MRIAYITERNLNSKQISGAITRDLRLLEILKSFAEVDLYFNNPTIFNKYLYLINNNNINKEVFNKIDAGKYDVIIISTFPISPYLKGYNKIKTKKIFYFADSAYHFRTQKQIFKYKIISYLLSLNEKKILKDNYCAYLGEDEIKYIPKSYHQNCLTFPFFINVNNNLFKNEGKLILVGDYSFRPNFLMLENINNIADKIQNDIYIYGKNIPKLEYKSNIKLIGYADTLEEIYKDSRALLYPINYGTGIKNKVLEAMSYGIPTIGFKEAFTNLNLEVEVKNDLVVQSNDDLVKSLNRNNLSSVSNKIYNHVEKVFNFDDVAVNIKTQLMEMINDKKNI